MTAKKSITSAILVFFLISCVCSISWQGTGNMTSSNMTFIWNTINANMPTYVSASKTNLSQLAVALSNKLNQEWSPAWNVFVFELFDRTVDAIFYGYSYKAHWMWFNDFSFAGRSFSFVIWKDYNCVVWNTIDNSMLQNNFANTDANAAIYNTLSSALTSLQASPITLPYNSYEEIWEHTHLVAKQMQSINPRKSYSIVAIQNGYMETTDSVNSMAGRFCSSGNAASFIFTRIAHIPSRTGYEGIHKVLVMETNSSWY